MTTLPEFISGEIWRDDRGVPINAHGGGILHHGGVYYWFGEHKVEGEAGNTAQVGVHVYSSADLSRWKDEGIALGVSDDPASDLVRGCIIERPKVLYHAGTQKFVMWFHHEGRGQSYDGARSGVAVADRVTGPYQFLRIFRPDAGVWPANMAASSRLLLTRDEEEQLKGAHCPGNSVPEPVQELLYRRDFAGGQMARDMTLFQDDDGSAYLIHSSEENSTLHISQLSDDFLTTRGRYIRVFPGRFHEAPALFKWRGQYFLFSSDCTGWAPNPARLSVADSIWGPWTELGNPCRGDERQTATTFESQSTFVLPVAGRENAFIFMGDRWRPKNAIDGRYIWLPVQFDQGLPFLEWKERWNLEFFAR